MEIVKVTQQGKDLIFTGVNKNGEVKVGILPISQANKSKPEWFTPILEGVNFVK